MGNRGVGRPPGDWTPVSRLDAGVHDKTWHHAARDGSGQTRILRALSLVSAAPLEIMRLLSFGETGWLDDQTYAKTWINLLIMKECPMLRITGLLAGIVMIFLDSTSAIASETLIVTGEGITSSENLDQYVKVGERLPVSELKKRFKGYSVQSTAGEDCLFCAGVFTNDVAFEVNYDETGIVVTSVVCGDGCSDALGNEVGSSLQSAIGEVGNCEAGYYTTCVSPRVSGLIYILSEDNSDCQLTIAGQSTSIPACAKVGAFLVQKQ